jgi:hypothetical protein
LYLPDELAEQARAADLNVSGLTQDAIRRALDAQAVRQGLLGRAYWKDTYTMSGDSSSTCSGVATGLSSS